MSYIQLAYIHLTNMDAYIRYEEEGTLFSSVVVPLLKRHDAASYVGTEDDLYTLLARDIGKYDPPEDLPQWDYSRPTISPIQSKRDKRRRGERRARKSSSKKTSNFGLMLNKIPASFDEFVARIQATDALFSMVEEFVSATEGVIMAGGFVEKIYFDYQFARNRWRSKIIDIDLFFVGLSEEEALAAITELQRRYATLCNGQSRWERGCSSISRTKNCITFYADYRKQAAQVILRLYDYTSEVLHSFDLGSCQIAYDGEEVFTTSAGLLALQMGINVLDLSRRRRSYEFRIIKYIKRGFSLVLPNLKPESTANPLNLELSHLFIKGGELADSVRPSDIIETYTGITVGDTDFYVGSYPAIRHNVANYIRQAYYNGNPYYVVRTSHSGNICTTNTVFIPSKYTNRVFEKVTSSLEIGELRIDKWRNMFPKNIMKLILTAYLDSDNPDPAVREEIIEKVHEFRDEVKTALSKIRMPLKWRELDEHNDLNSSFGMERIPGMEWYGPENYLPNGWYHKCWKCYSPEIRAQIIAILVINRHEESVLSKLPAEIIYEIINKVVPKPN